MSSRYGARSRYSSSRLLGRAERGERFLRKIAISATLVGGGSWRRTLTLREPFADAGRLRTALGPKLAELPAPVLKLKLEVLELTESTGRAAGARPPRRRRAARPAPRGPPTGQGKRGEGGVCTVVEVAPWSRIPGTAGTARRAGRLNAPRPVLVEAHFDGTPWGSTAGCSAHPRGVARRRSLVDRGAGAAALFRRGAGGRRARGRLLGRRRLVQPARSLMAVPASAAHSSA